MPEGFLDDIEDSDFTYFEFSLQIIYAVKYMLQSTCMQILKNI